MSDDEWIAAFEEGTIPSGSFHHKDHVRLAFLYLGRHSCLEALQRFTVYLTRFATANGSPELYNETVTWAFILIIHDRIARTGNNGDWLNFSESNPDLLDWKEALSHYYQSATLSSDLAKRTFLFPDLHNGNP